MRALRNLLILLAAWGTLIGGNWAAAQDGRQATAIVPALSQQVDGARIGWTVNALTDPFKQAMTDGKPIVVYFTAKLCNWCILMTANVLRCPAVNTLAGRAHFVMIVDQGFETGDAGNLSRSLGIDSFPTISVLQIKPGNDINELFRAVGMADEAGVLKNFAKYGLEPSPPNPLPLSSVALGTQIPRGCGPRGLSDDEQAKLPMATIILPAGS